MKNNPLISIIIINKSERSVQDTLAKLEGQLSANCELLIIDASLGKLDDIYKQFSVATIIPFISSSNKKITIPEQRNVGIRNAHGKIIVFIDAGCIPSKNWLTKLTRPIIENSEVIVAGGTLSTGKPTFHDAVYETNRPHKYIDQAPTINLAIKRSVFKDIGYFDEELLYGSDFDFTWRVNKSNIKIYNQPMALVRHDWGDLKQELKRGYRYGQAKTKLYRKHRTDTVTFLKRESTLVMYAGFLCLLPLAIIWPYLLLILLIPITKSLLERNGLALPLINFYTAYGALITYLNDTTWIKT